MAYQLRSVRGGYELVGPAGVASQVLAAPDWEETFDQADGLLNTHGWISVHDTPGIPMVVVNHKAENRTDQGICSSEIVLPVAPFSYFGGFDCEIRFTLNVGAQISVAFSLDTASAGAIAITQDDAANASVEVTATNAVGTFDFSFAHSIDVEHTWTFRYFSKIFYLYIDNVLVQSWGDGVTEQLAVDGFDNRHFELQPTIDKGVGGTTRVQVSYIAFWFHSTSPQRRVLLAIGGGVVSQEAANSDKVPTGDGLWKSPSIALFDHFTDVASTSTNGTENDLYSDTIAARQLASNGDKLDADYCCTIVASATATRRIQAYFGGTKILDSGTLTFAAAGTADVWIKVIRESATVVRVRAEFVPAGISLQPVVTYTRITGLTLTNTQILKLTGIAASTGAAASDIVAKSGNISYTPAA